MVLLTFILTYLPMHVTSLPIVVFQDRNSHASSYIDDQLVFDVSFAFVLFIVLLITFIWITARMTTNRLILLVNWLLAISIAFVDRVADQLYYFRIDTIFRIAATFLVDANDARRDPPLL